MEGSVIDCGERSLMFRPTRRGCLAAAASLALASFVGISGAAEEEGAYGMKVGSGSRLVLSLDVATRYESNIYHQETDEESAIGLVVRPSALLMTDRGALRHQIALSGEAGARDVDGDADDYFDGLLGATAQWHPLTRHRFEAGANWQWDHDPFGTRRTEGTALADRSLDRWEQKAANAVYRFGAPNATLNLETEAAVSDREYTTNRLSTRFLDHDVSSLRGTALFNVSSKTSLLAEVIHADIDYDQVAAGFPSRAGEVTRYRVGARWRASGKTTGEIKVGRIERDFDSPVQEDYEELDWQVLVTWEPRPRDRIRFIAGREPEESYINASRIIDDQFYQVKWRHDWTSFFHSELGYAYDDLDFRGIDRQDDFHRWTLDLEYKPSRRWSVFADFTLRERDSTFPSRDFENTIVTTGIRLTY